MMKHIYPKDIIVKYVNIYFWASVVLLILSILMVGNVSTKESGLYFIVILLSCCSLFLFITCIIYYIYTFVCGYYIEADSIKTRTKNIPLSKIKGIGICYGYNTHTRYGPVKIKKIRKENGTRKKVDCLWMSVLEHSFVNAVPNMTNMDIYRCTGKKEIYGFAVFSVKYIENLLENYDGMYFIPKDIYMKNEDEFLKIIQKYNIPKSNIKVMEIDYSSNESV